MASVESIGACSLDFERSSSDNFISKDLTASECTLRSTGITPTIQESSRNGNMYHDMPSEQRYPVDAAQVSNGYQQSDGRECTVAEIKLPSYVSISCAINGYTNYSRFCRSRDNSPARSSFRKSSLEPSMLTDMNGKESFLGDKLYRYSRSQSDCNGRMQSVFTESKHVTVSKQLQIPIKSTRKYTTEVSVSNGHCVTSDRTESSLSKSLLTNGHDNEKLVLAKEVGNGETKSLVQQRIESLYGKSATNEIRINVKTSSKQKELRVNGEESSPSSLPASLNGHKGSVSPPVFRHLNEDFRKQLQVNPSNRKVESERQILESKLQKDSKKPPVSIQRKENGFSSSLTNGHDECDRLSKTPPPVLIDSYNGDDLKPGEEREGYKFLNFVDVEKEKIQIQVQQLEEELKKGPNIPEEASGKIRAACGKANLLMSQKFEQFKGLCWKNIEENPNVPFYTTASDLAGFWDMVMLQVDDINSTFSEIKAMKENGWKEIAPRKPSVSDIKPRSSNCSLVSKSNPNTPKRSAKSAELAKAREEARKQLLAAKKRGRQQNTLANDADVAIFTPATN
ncbi:Disks large-associated protein 1, partial [Stegodyphus mimosarum]